VLGEKTASVAGRGASHEFQILRNLLTATRRSTCRAGCRVLDATSRRTAMSTWHRQAAADRQQLDIYTPWC